MNKIDAKARSAYEKDFVLWSAEQAALLRAGRFEELDRDRIAEEIESLGRSEKYQIDSRMEVLIQHLVKWRHQPSARSNSWKATIVEQRVRIARLLKDSPSLGPYPADSMPGSFRIALYAAQRETGLPESAFPETCPSTVEEILDPDFLPE